MPLGVIALERGDLAGAEREIAGALKDRPDLRLAHFNLALLAEVRHDDQLAIAEYKKEIELFPKSYKAAFNLGNVYERLGDRARQIDAYRSAIEMNPQFADGHILLAKVLLGAHQLGDAATLARKGLELGGSAQYRPLGHYVLADVYSRQGRSADASREAARGRTLEAASRR
jgi:tetratricopeptide (TPR) repeat protein